MQAKGGIAVFDDLIPLQPSVYITNITTGAPYVANVSVQPRVCCSLVYLVYTTQAGLASTITSNPFQTFRSCAVLPTMSSVTQHRPR